MHTFYQNCVNYNFPFEIIPYPIYFRSYQNDNESELDWEADAVMEEYLRNGPKQFPKRKHGVDLLPLLPMSDEPIAMRTRSQLRKRDDGVSEFVDVELVSILKLFFS